MIERKRRLIFIQLILLIFGLLILYNTYYYNKDSNPENEIISHQPKKISDNQRTS